MRPLQRNERLSTNWSGLDLIESGAARSREAKGQQPWLERRAAVSKIGDEADACREAVRTGVQGHNECCFEDGLVIPAVLA